MIALAVRLRRTILESGPDTGAGPDAYAENRPASDEMVREACRVEWIG